MISDDKINEWISQLHTAKIVITPIVNEVTAIGMAQPELDRGLWDALRQLNTAVDYMAQAQVHFKHMRKSSK